MKTIKSNPMGPEKYVKPEMEIIELKNQAIITSGCEMNECPTEEPGYCSEDGV